jgi:hypothetical protein
VLRGVKPQLARVSVALRAVPGEFDLSWVGRIASAARQQPELVATLPPEAIQRRLSGLDAALQAAHDSVTELCENSRTLPLIDALCLAQHLLRRLRTGWYASGLWARDAVNAQDAAEVEAVEDELLFRLRSIQRAMMLRAGDLAPDEAQRLQALCDGMVTSVA